jgi:hypothetical protein
MRISQKEKHLIIILTITPAIIAPLILLGVYAGSYLANFGLPPILMQSLLSTAGFILGIYFVGRIIVFLANKTAKDRAS